MGTKQKAWLCSNFRVEIGSLPCARVASVESFTGKCFFPPDPTGIPRPPTKFPTRITVPDLTLAISMAGYAAWADTAKKWFIEGERNGAREMSGRIIFLGPNLKDDLGEISLQNIGFKKFSLLNPESTSEAIPRFNVDLYVERMASKVNAYGS